MNDIEPIMISEPSPDSDAKPEWPMVVQLTEIKPESPMGVEYTEVKPESPTSVEPTEIKPESPMGVGPTENKPESRNYNGRADIKPTEIEPESAMGNLPNVVNPKSPNATEPTVVNLKPPTAKEPTVVNPESTTGNRTPDVKSKSPTNSVVVKSSTGNWPSAVAKSKSPKKPVDMELEIPSKESHVEYLKNPPGYVQTKTGHQSYPRTSEGEEFYCPGESGKVNYCLAEFEYENREIVAKTKDGKSKYLLDEHGGMILPFNYSKLEFVFEKDPITGDDKYPVNVNTGREFYPKFQNDEQYAFDKHGNQIPLRLPDGTGIYAKMCNGDEFYPKCGDTLDEYYIRNGDVEILAKRADDTTFYAKRENGDEFYPRIFNEIEWWPEGFDLPKQFIPESCELVNFTWVDLSRIQRDF